MTAFFENPGPEQRDPGAQISLRAILTPRPSSPASLPREYLTYDLQSSRALACRKSSLTVKAMFGAVCQRKFAFLLGKG
jgi:hypothetical protein